MTEEEDAPDGAVVDDIAAVLERHGVEATGGRRAAEVAREWAVAGFADAEEVDDWLSARCFTPAGALALDRAGLTPEQAAILTSAGTSGGEDTLGFKLTNGQLSFEEARRIITSDFWNA